MTYLYNDPAGFKDDMVDGFVAAYRRYVRRVPDTSGVMRAEEAPRKVSLVIGGGSGHYPAFCGLVGTGLADGTVIGDIFTSPSAEQAYRVAKATDTGAGVLFSYGNYAGDVINFGLAQDRLREEGVDCRTVLVTDDVASAPPEDRSDRRGIAGGFCVFKIAGAASELGWSLDEVERVARAVNDATFTLGVAFAGCRFPGAVDPLFTVAPGTMELGLGIHGEPGVRTVAALSAAELAEQLVGGVLAERPEGVSGRAAVILNGLGSTKYEELFVVWKDVTRLLENAGVELVDPEVGELVTSLDMAGCSLTVSWLDDELEPLWRTPAATPAFRRDGPTVEPRPADTPSRAAAIPAPRTEAVAPPASAASLQAAAGVRDAIASMVTAIDAAEQHLGDLDAVAGDGDHGRGMVRGLHAAHRAVASPDLGVGGTLRAAGAAWADDGAGTSGVLWGQLLRTVGDALGDVQVPTAEAVAAAVAAGAAEVERLGGAALGDKTMLDALLPFSERLAAEVDAGRPLAEAWRTAVEVANRAARATAELTPKVGRARPLAERSVGTPDPGAVSLVLCLTATAEVLSGGDR